MGSKLIGFRVPSDLAEQLEARAAEEGRSTSELLRELVDDKLYPKSGRERLEARREVAPLADLEQLYDVSITEFIAEKVNTQIKEELKEHLGGLVNEYLELVQVDRGLTDAERESIDQLDHLVGQLTQRLDKVLEQVNKNVQVVNENFREWGNKVYLLFQALDKHTHNELTGNATMDSSAAGLISAEVRIADKHRGELPGPEEPHIIQGKTDKPGYKFYEHLNLSVKEVKETLAAVAEEKPHIIQGRTMKPGYKFHEQLNLSVREE